MGKVRARAVLSLAILLACGAGAWALDPSLDISQYAHTAWRIREGFTKGRIFSMAQTPDGYLWLGTDLGLLRFDGVRAAPWHPPAGQQLPSNLIRSLLVAHDGTLWIGTDKGLASWKDGKLTQYAEVASQAIDSLLQDRRGTVWFGTYQPGNGRLCAIRGGKTQCYGAGTFGDGVFSLYEDRQGRLWAGAHTAVWRWTPGPPEQYKFSRGTTHAIALIDDDRGALLLAGNDGLKELVSGQIQNYELPGVARRFRPDRFLRSSDGSLWIGTYQGLWRLHQGKVDKFTTADGLSSDTVLFLFEDRENNVWVATTGGLDRFRQYAVTTISSREGLSTLNAWSVQAASDGSLWIGTADGLNRWRDGRVTVYGRRDERGQSSAADEPELALNRSVTEIVNSGLAGNPRSLGLDGQGRLWVSTGDGVFRSEGDHFVRVPGVPGGDIYSIAGDGQGSVWIVNSQLGLFDVTAEGHVQQVPWSRFGPNATALSLLPDRAQGGAWLGFSSGGVAYFNDGQVRLSYIVADGLGNGEVTHLRFGSRGVLWAATEGGLSRIKDGHLATLTSRNGLPCDMTIWSMEDDDHAAWLYMPCGLVRIMRSELDAWASDPRRVVQNTVFDDTDGVRSIAHIGGYGPHVTKSPDGKIWFVPEDGASVIDPLHLPYNKLPPPVHIEQITADGKVYDAAAGTGRLRLPPLVRYLDIDYTALSLVVPEKVRFRVKLEGQDKDWRELVNVRRVEYTNLPPQHYRFRVTACNNSGVWNEEGASVEFVIPAAWYQTNWFRVLCGAAFLALLVALYQLRTEQLRREERKLREALETIPAMAWAAGTDGMVQFMNRRWLDYAGRSPREKPNEIRSAAIHPEDRERIERRWGASIASGEPFEEEMRLRRANGEYRWFLSRAVPLRDKRGKVVKWYGASTDIEDRKRSEQLQAELAHTNRVSMLGELAASIAHEVNQPISGVVSNGSACLRWLARDVPDVEEAREAARRIVRDGKRAGEVITRIRALTKRAVTPREKLDLNETIRDLLAFVGDEAKGKSIVVRTQLADDLSPVSGDRVQLQQVILNLVMNAIEAMSSVEDRPRELLITTRNLAADEVQVTVKDSGPGIDPNSLDRIFDPFYTTKPGGMGMGLSISRSILQAHGGRLWAAAKDGPGTIFHFSLPKYREEAESNAAA